MSWGLGEGAGRGQLVLCVLFVFPLCCYHCCHQILREALQIQLRHSAGGGSEQSSPLLKVTRSSAERAPPTAAGSGVQCSVSDSAAQKTRQRGFKSRVPERKGSRPRSRSPSMLRGGGVSCHPGLKMKAGFSGDPAMEAEQQGQWGGQGSPLLRPPATAAPATPALFAQALPGPAPPGTWWARLGTSCLSPPESLGCGVRAGALAGTPPRGESGTVRVTKTN